MELKQLAVIERIIEWSIQGESPGWIAKRVQMHPSQVLAIQNQYRQEIQQKQEEHLKQYLRERYVSATKANQYLRNVVNGTVKPEHQRVQAAKALLIPVPMNGATPSETLEWLRQYLTEDNEPIQRIQHRPVPGNPEED